MNVRVTALHAVGSNTPARPWLVLLDGEVLRGRNGVGRRFASQARAEQAGARAVRARGATPVVDPPCGEGFGPYVAPPDPRGARAGRAVSRDPAYGGTHG